MYKVKIINILIIVFIAQTQLAFSQISKPNILTAYRTENKIKLDGRLDEPCWANAVRINNFTQRELNEGEPASEKTEVAAVYTERTLYLGIWCYDSQPQNIVAHKLERDFSSHGEDNVEIVIDTYHDRRNCYHFIVNPNGARYDELITDEGRGRNRDWNGVWDAKAKITDQGWFVEIEIPFSTLKFKETDKQIWGVNFERNISRKHEQILWQGWSRNYYLEQVSHAGILAGIEGISSGHLVEIKPYITAGVEKHESENISGIAHIGGDIDYLMSSNLKLNLTANTDFAQIESDRSVINLSRFSIYYPEKRSFFLEGKEAFSFGARGMPSVFYSRRIGIKNGSQIPIIGGVRLMGKTGRINVGMLSMQTDAAAGDPSTNFSVLRLKQDIAGQSNVGMIVTSKNSSAGSNYVYGVDANYVTSHLFGDKNLSIGGSFAQSQTGSNNNGNSTAYSVYLSSDNDKVEYDFAFTRVQKNFDPQIGFLRRKNYKFLYTELQFNPRPSFIKWIRKMEVKPIDVDAYFTDDTNELETLGMEWRPLGFSTKSGEYMEYNIQRFYDRLDEPFEINDGVVLPIGGYWYTRHELQGGTYRGRKISAGMGASWGDFYTGSRTEIAVELTANINRHFNLSCDYSYNDLKFPEGAFRTHEIGGRAQYAFNTKLFTSFFGQWNNEDNKILINFRLNWIPKIGSDFYLAINQILDTSGGKLEMKDFTILSKFVWRFVI
ncbi:hypothetical protein DRQ07_02765 [candidate division KSB1 bacterium]|nr:MAG: hypothetical protein DRQ07_02765 [candidate division KSB1 bacterium]